jgi:amino acid adenylation domain-containing protein
MKHEDYPKKSSILASQKIKERDYWLNKLSGDLIKSSFPHDNMKIDQNRAAKDTDKFKFTGDLYGKLMNLSNGSDYRLHIILAAAVILLLERYTSNKDIILGVPIHRQETEGDFINTVLAVRMQITDNLTVKELILQAAKTIVEANDNQNYPMESLLYKLNIPYSQQDFPLFDTAVLLENIHEKKYLRPISLNIIFSFNRTEKDIEGVIQYNSSTYNKQTIKRIILNLTHLLQAALLNVDLKLSHLDILSDEEKKQLLQDFNGSKIDLPGQKRLHHFLEHQAKAAKDRVAIVHKDGVLTYNCLNERVHQLARFLQDNGIQNEQPVGILLTRSLRMVESILAVWKAGGAYIPIDLLYPGERIKYILDDSQISILLTDSQVVKKHSFSHLMNFPMTGIKPHLTAPRPDIIDFDRLPIPDRSLVNYEKYSRYIDQAMVKNSISLQTTRGCPYHCVFCHKIWSKQHRIRSAENIFSEVMLYYKMGVRNFVIIDDIFNLNQKNSSRFFELIIENNLDLHLFFPNGLRGDILTKEYIDLMIKAGTVNIALALETASPRLQKLIGKNLNIDKLKENLEYICDKYPHVVLELFTMHGFPTETEKEAMMTLEFVKSLEWIHFPYVAILKIYPKTDMEKLALDQGIPGKAIARSANLAGHELPETLPFNKKFTLKYQAEFLQDYFLLKRRLLHVLPYQMKVLKEDEIVQKYNSYLPVDIRSLSDLLEFTGISKEELKIKPGDENNHDHFAVAGLNEKIKSAFPSEVPSENAFRVLLLDLSLYFTADRGSMLYDIASPPLGLMYLMTYLKQKFGKQVDGRIAKSRIDFDNYEELKTLIEEFKPQVIGIRTLTFFRDFFHKTVSMIRNWGITVPIITGGPYATSDFETILQDNNVDLAVLGEGEVTFSEIIGKIMANDGKLPGEADLKEIAGITYIPGNPDKKKKSSGKVILLDELESVLSGKSSENLKPVEKRVDSSYIIYTSGTTGKPKGVMVKHFGMMNHIQAKINDVQITKNSIVAQNSPHTFDISVWQFFSAFVVGGKTVIYSTELIRMVEQFLSRLIKDQVTILEVVPSYLSVMLNSMETRQHVRLFLEYLLVTGEEVNSSLVNQWFEIYPGIKIVNAYGATETSDDITHHMMTKAPGSDLISIGKPIRNLNLYIVDENMKLCPIGAQGEICVSGIGVGRGYLNDAEKTSRVFIGDPFVKEKEIRLYKTGDIGCWLPDGTINFFGRKDHQIKIRGFRIELGEIESKLANHPGIKEVVVIDKDDVHGIKYLCAYLVPSISIKSSADGKLNWLEIKDYLLKHLPDYMVPSHFVQLDKMPLTPNGKIDRKALSTYKPTGETENPSPLLFISQEMLEKAKYHASNDQAYVSWKQPEESLNSLMTLYQEEISSVHQYSQGKKKTYFPLSFPQKVIYYSEQKYPGTTSENNIFLIKYSEEIDRQLLERAINKFIYKNEGMRLRIVEIEHKFSPLPAQYVHDFKPQRIECFDFSAKNDDKSLERWLKINNEKAFNLIDNDLFYFACVKFNEKESGYYMKLHHIISDGWTVFLVFSGIHKIYTELKAGKTIDDKLNPSYLEFLTDEMNYLKSPQAKRDLEFWYKKLDPMPEPVTLLTKKVDEEVVSPIGEVRSLTFPDGLRTQMHRYCQERNTSIYKLILSALSIYISKVCGKNHFGIGTVNHNRALDVHRKMTGGFISFSPIIINIKQNESFYSFVKRLGEEFNYMLRNHQRYPFDLLAAGIREQAGIDLKYLYNIILIGHPDYEEENFKIKRIYQGQDITPLTIHINVSNRDKDGILDLEWNYLVEYFSESDITQIHQGLINILKDALDNPEKKLTGIEMISKEEKNRIPNGSIEFPGQINPPDWIKGISTAPDVIERILLKHDDIDEAVVMPKAAPSGDKYLLAFLVSVNQKSLMESEIKEYLAKELPIHMPLPRLVQLEKFPVTSNGRVDKRLLQAIEISTDETVIAPATPVEKEMVEIWSEVLGIKKEMISTTSNFFDLGGHSLRAMVIVAQMHKKLHVKIPLAEIFKTPTIKELSGYIKGTLEEKYASIKPTEKKEYYPQSSAQKRLFFLDHFENIGISYNVFSIFKIAGEFNKERHKNAIMTVIERHDTLRTSFESIDNKPVQIVHDKIEFEIREFQLKNEPAEEETKKIINDFVRPFDLSKAPLLRVGLIRLTGKEHLLLYDMHHIISDGTSMGILIDDFAAAYPGKQLPPLGIQYKDFSVWQNKLIEKGKIKQQEDYWLNIYPDEIPRLDLPLDHTRPQVFSFKGNNYAFKLGKEETTRFKQCSSEIGATLFMNLLASLNILLHKYSRQEDIIVGCSIFGRPHPDLEKIIGMFVNELAIRNFPTEEKTYREFIEEVKVNSLKAFENQDYQFEELIDRLNLPRDPSRNPLFDVCLSFQNEEQAKSHIRGAVFVPYHYENNTTKFDLTLFAHEASEELYFIIEYCSSLFKPSTIKRLANHLLIIIDQVGRAPGIGISEIVLLTNPEKHRLLIEFNALQCDYPGEKTIHQLFEEQVEKTPDRTAVVYQKESVTYRLLEEKANQLANYLYRRKNVHPDHMVGLLTGKSIHCIVAILGILKSGGAYVPISPTQPEERIKNILDDAGIKVVISLKKYIKALNRLQWECKQLECFLCMDSLDVYGEDEAEENRLMDKKLWEYVAETAVDEITGGGWQSSYTGEPIPKEQMDEYGDNILKKLTPLLHKEMRVLEIGCATGISMYRIAPKVALYHGTDLSGRIIEMNEQRVKEEGHQNIILSCLAAHELDQLEEESFDLIIMNSVIQHFHGHNYLRKVLKKAVRLTKPRGFLFIGDIMDQEKKESLINEMIRFKRKNKNKNYRTKTDWSEELFISRLFFEDLKSEMPGISQIEFSDKIRTIENELTKFRYDALIAVDKTNKSSKINPQKHKYQEDKRDFEQCPVNRVTSGVRPNHLAYVIHTSGSTGMPKGALIEHRNVVSLLKNNKSPFDFNSDDVWTMFHSYSFDFSVWEMYGALLYGGKLVVIPHEVSRDTEQYLKQLKKESVTVLNQTPSAFYALMNEELRYWQSQLKIRYVIFGGEALHPGRLIQWREKYPGIRLINMYGITETTVHVTYKEITANEVAMDKSYIGKAIPTLSIYILDGTLRLLPLGVVGELCVGGEGVCRGYLNRLELTREKFIDNPYQPGEKLYRSGDLARVLENGELEYSGRIDHQVKIRGYRIEPGEIESRLNRHDEIKESIVLAKPGKDNEKYICAYIVSHRQLDPSQLREYLSRDLPGYMLPAYFFMVDKIPLTASGKVNRQALPDPRYNAAPGQSVVAPGDEVEDRLAAIWSEVLGIEKNTISVDADFFELGGHSLRATTVISMIHKELKVKVPLIEIFKTPTIIELAAYIKKASKEKYESILPLEEKEYYPVSSAQKRMFLLDRLKGADNIGDTVPEVMQIEGDLDGEHLENVFRKLINRHDILRTSFDVIDDNIVQRVYRDVVFGITYIETEENKVKTIIKDFICPFDLRRAPLLRVTLVKLAEKKHIIMFHMHHIVIDGTSMQLFSRDFTSIYEGFGLPQLRIQGKDFASWQNIQLQHRMIKKQEEYWLKVFSGHIPVLNIPTDYPRPPVQIYEGNAITFRFDKKISTEISRIISQKDVTLYMILLAIYNILLAKYSGQEDIIVGSAIQGRRHPDLENVIGFFVNTLAIRNFPGGEKTFSEFLEEVKSNCLQAYENQDVQFEQLVSRLGIPPDISRQPLFSTMLQYMPAVAVKRINKKDPENLPIPRKKMSDLQFKPYEFENNSIQLDLMLHVIESGDTIGFHLLYSTKLFKSKTIERFVQHFLNIAEEVVANPDIKISNIKMFSPWEEEALFQPSENVVDTLEVEFDLQIGE